MRSSIVALCALLVAGVVHHASGKQYPEGYWERGFHSSNHAKSFSITMKVADPDATSKKITKKLAKKGIALAASHNYAGQGNQRRDLQGLIPLAIAEKTAKSLISEGNLQQYSMQELVNPAQIKEMDERIAAVKAEVDGNSDALSKMPVASHLLHTLLTRLEKSREAHEKSKERAILQVTLLAEEQ